MSDVLPLSVASDADVTTAINESSETNCLYEKPIRSDSHATSSGKHVNRRDSSSLTRVNPSPQRSDTMESTYSELDQASKDLAVFRGQKIELERERSRLNNHRQVFLEQLKRIESELEDVDGKLTTVGSGYRAARWRTLKLRVLLACHVTLSVFRHLYALLSFLFLNLLHVAHISLSLFASVTRMILDTQERQESHDHHHHRAASVSFVFQRCRSAKE